jgi:hypothetical protein
MWSIPVNSEWHSMLSARRRVGFSGIKSDYLHTQIKNSPARTREFSTSWRLGVITCPVMMGVVGVRFGFSDYKSDYFFLPVLTRLEGACYFLTLFLSVSNLFPHFGHYPPLTV